MQVSYSGKFASRIPPQTVDEMKEIALKAQENSYCPYSHYKVSAAVLTDSGKIFSGVNVENASFSPTCCAERVAIFKAVSEGHRDIKAVMIVVGDDASPCGVCRQVVNEFNPEAYIFCSNRQGKIYNEYRLNEILPYGFGPAQLATNPSE